MSEYLPIPPGYHDSKRPVDLDLSFHLLIHDIPTEVRIVNIVDRELLTIFIDGEHLFSRNGVLLAEAFIGNRKKWWWQR